MARIVAGFATSFSPQLHAPVENWAAMGQRDAGNQRLLGPDGRYHSYDELVAAAGPQVPEALQSQEQAERHQRCQEHIATLSQKLRAAELDALVIITDDEHRLFGEDNFPAVYVFHGDPVPYVSAGGQPGTAWAYGTENLNLPGATALGDHLVASLTANEIDVSRASKLPEDKGVGHHIGFANTRLLGNKRAPFLPILFNASFPPNVPTTRRTYRIGEAARAAIASWDQDARVGVLAVGGMSHPVIDEDLDRRLLQACAANDVEALASLPPERLAGGNGQSRVWIAAAGALKEMQMNLLEYVPAYRSAGGTGCGMAFAYWE